MGQLASRFAQWTEFLVMDDETRSILESHLDIPVRHIDSIMDAIYAHISASPAASVLFRTPESLARAREAQKRHWLHHVFSGNFDAEYRKGIEAIGLTHYRLGVDLMLYVGVYSVVMGELIRITSTEFQGRHAACSRYLSALNRAIFLDSGMVTMIYYGAQVGEVEKIASELNHSLARAGEYRDNETGRHITRMGKMCRALAVASGHGGKWAEMIQIASPLHDVGKIGIPDSVLLKPGRLTEEEFAVMRRHPLIGGDIIPEDTADVIRMARRISLTHHEKWDGSGYPAGLREEEIPLEGRIAAICDVYDALISVRPYKPAWPREEALAFLERNRGQHFDPDLVGVFLSILPEIDAIQAEYAEQGEC